MPFALAHGVIRWSEEKDQWLRVNCGVSFQEISVHILADDLIEMIESASRKAQQAFIIRHSGYAWVVPFVAEEDNSILLKTAYASRKMTRKYGGKNGAKN